MPEFSGFHTEGRAHWVSPQQQILRYYTTNTIHSINVFFDPRLCQNLSQRILIPHQSLVPPLTESRSVLMHSLKCKSKQSGGEWEHLLKMQAKHCIPGKDCSNAMINVSYIVQDNYYGNKKLLVRMATIQMCCTHLSAGVDIRFVSNLRCSYPLGTRCCCHSNRKLESPFSWT